MKDTKLLAMNQENLELAKQDIQNGGVVAIPTETVYGLAANAFDPEAVARIFEVKGRPQDNPLIVHISDMEMLKDVTSSLPATAVRLAEAFWSGPLTMILPKSEKIPDVVSAGLDTVGVRMPSHPVAKELIRACGVPLAAPSANASGKPSPTSAEHVFYDLKGRINYILDGGECEVGIESTVVRVYEDKVEILRPGKITVDDLLKVVPAVTIDDGVFTQMDEDEAAASPGMKYKHYSPNANVIMVEGSLVDFCRYVSKHADEHTGVLVFEGEESLFSIPCITCGKKSDSGSQANRLFDALREIDQNKNLTTVFARVPKQDGVGLAVYNRLLRACGFEVVNMDQAVMVGLTGPSGSGKTIISEAFRNEEDFGVIDCDIIAADVRKMPQVIERVRSYFGAEVLNEDGSINRKALGKKVFADEESRIFLNSVMYPFINIEIRKTAEQLRRKKYRFIILDAPTLFESGADMICDTIVSVIAPPALRKQRIMARDHMTEQEAQNRMNSQHDEAFYSSRSEYVIVNDGSLDEAKQQVSRIIKSIKEKIDGNNPS